MAMMDIFPALFDNYFIKIVFLVHATLISLANIGSFLSGYSSYNLILLLCILLAILVDKNADILLVAIAFDVICIVLDILYFVSGPYLSTISVLLMVLNLCLRPVSAILLLKNYSARAGVDDPTSGLLEVNVQPPRSTYQNIEEPNQSVP